MNFDRSTLGPSPLRWLNVIQRGGTSDWRDLYERCRDRTFATLVADLLPMGDPDGLPSVRLWEFLLEDLHPGLITAHTVGWRMRRPARFDDLLAR